jgi:molecular chaperone GrpE (heat shock protein)
VILENKETIEKLIEKLTSTSKKLKQKDELLAAKDQELSDLKIDFVEVSQMLEEYKAELEKVGDIEQVKKRLENEKLARRQLVLEKVITDLIQNQN